MAATRELQLNRSAAAATRGRAASIGATLPELLVVLAIIGLVLAITVPNLSGSEDRASVRSAARQLVSLLSTARNQAIANRTPYAVVIDTSRVITETEIPRPSTRIWIALLDPTFDPATDDTDIPDTPAGAPFLQIYTPLDLDGDVVIFPENVVVVGSLIDGIHGNDFTLGAGGGPRINSLHTEDFDLDGAVVAAEDLGEDGRDTGDRTISAAEAVDIGEDNVADGIDNDGNGTIDDEIDPRVRYIRFGAQGNADRAIIWLWDAEDGRTEIPAGVATNFPQSLRLIGLPPGMTLTTGAPPPPLPALPALPHQDNFFRVPDPASIDDARYYTVVVNPVTGNVQSYDYARGLAGVADIWDLAKDGA